MKYLGSLIASKTFKNFNSVNTGDFKTPVTFWMDHRASRQVSN